jgi:ceramide glucosyltransferase
MTAAWTTVGYCAVACYALLLLMKAWLSVRHIRKFPEHEALGGEVTIVQPILSGDPLLEETLRTNVRQVPDGTRFLWLVDEDDQEAKDITTRIARDARVRVACVACPPVVDGINPKAAKLDVALPAVRTPYLAVLDDDTTITATNLAKAMGALGNADLYTGLPCYQSRSNFWSSLVAHFVNNNNITTYLPLLEIVGPISINGMFYVIRTETLRQMGGFGAILHSLCDDYAMARLVKRHGGRIVQGVAPQYIETSVRGPAHYASLMHRWFVFANVLLRDQRLAVKILLTLTLGLPPLLLWLGLACLLGGWLGAGVLAGTLLGRYCILRQLHRIAFEHRPSVSPLTSLLSELLQPFHWLHAAMVPVITWRTRRIRVHLDGTFSLLK